MTHEPTEAAILDDLQSSIAVLIGEFTTTLAPMVINLVDTHQRGLGFITYEGKQLQDQMIRRDREDLAKRQRQARYLGRLPKDGFIVGRGESPAPGNVAGISAEAEIWATLSDLVRRLVRDQATRGLCTLTRIPTEPTIEDLLAGLRSLVWQTPTMQLLETTRRDLEHLRETALALIDGNDRTVLGADCPHCERRTLVVYFKEDLIRCDRDPKSGRYEPCVCNDPVCGCKTGRGEFRHEWHRAKGTKPNGWWALADRLNLTRNQEESPA